MLRHTFTAAPGAALTLLLAIFAAAPATSAGGRDPVPRKGAATDISSIVPSRVYTRAQVSSGGLNLNNLRGGAIHITGVARPVQQAFLYWSVISKGVAPETAGALRIQRIYPYPVSRDVEIKGIAVATGPNLCRNDADGGDTVTIFRGVVPLAVANGDGAYVIQLNPIAAGPRPAWSGASLVVVGSGSGKVSLFDSGLAGRTAPNRTGRTYSLPLGVGVSDTSRVIFHSIGVTDGGDCQTPVAKIVTALPVSPEGLAERISKPDLLASRRTPSARAGLPDLTVTSGNFQNVTGNRVIIGHRPATFEWAQLTENKGSATAPRSKTDVSIDLGGISFILGQTAIPKLLPRKFFASVKNIRLDLPLGEEFGTYPVSICADSNHRINESDESNNCRKPKPIHVVPTRFTGRVNGSTNWAGSVFITWSAEVTYNQTAIEPLGGGVNIDYTFTGVNVKYEVAGTNAGCRWSGTGTDRPPVQGIRLFFDKTGSSYIAANFNSPGFTVLTTIKCPGAEPFNFPLFPPLAWFFTGHQTFANPGLLELEGESRAFPHKFSWILLPSG